MVTFPVEATRPADLIVAAHLTNGFSKKAENHAYAVAIHFMWYNFAKIHQTLRVTPAMAAGVTDRVWEAEEIVGLLET